MGVMDYVVKKVVGSFVKGAAKEGKLEDGTLRGEAHKEWQREQREREGVEKVREIEKRERADRTA